MKKIVISGAVAALLSVPAMAQNAGNASIDELRQTVERLEGEVEYLKETAMADRKDTAQKAVTLETLATTAGKYTWSGDFRYRSEHITTATNSATPEETRNRDRIRARFGVTVKVNDTITGRLQFATSNDSRSTNQTLGDGWTRKPVNIDLAYVDWKAHSTTNVILGKMAMPWLKTTSYYFDGDLSPEGAAAKFVKGNLFGSIAYMWLNERHSGAVTGLRADSKLKAAQFGIRQPFGTTTLTAAVGYFDLDSVKDEIVTGTGCTANTTFFGGATNGNSTRTLNGCTVLLSDFNVINALAQVDFMAGKFPMSVFVDYMKNGEAEPITVAGNQVKLDTAIAAGVTFNRVNAGLAKTWEAGLIYQVGEKDAIFGEFHDSDFGDGRTDSDGIVLKGSYVPAVNWTVAATYFINKLNNDGVASTANTYDLDYKRLQLDLNYRF